MQHAMASCFNCEVFVCPTCFKNRCPNCLEDIGYGNVLSSSVPCTYDKKEIINDVRKEQYKGMEDWIEWFKGNELDLYKY